MQLEVQNADEDSISQINAVIPSLTVKSIVNTEIAKKVILEYSNNSVPRKDVYEYCVKNEWILLEMTSSTDNLEDIFMNLTKDGEAINA